jgi:hypothetical protein
MFSVKSPGSAEAEVRRSEVAVMSARGWHRSTQNFQTYA